MLDRITTGAAMELFDDRIAVNSLAPEARDPDRERVTLIKVPDSIVEPVETFAEATLALCTGDPAVLTGRVATSLSLLVELGRPVRTLDGDALAPRLAARRDRPGAASARATCARVPRRRHRHGIRCRG